MRKITNNMRYAFYKRNNWQSGNTRVETIDGETSIYLFGNKIAVLDNDNNTHVTNAGWETNTTKERLNALDNVSIRQKDNQWYLNGKKWDGELIRI